MHQLPSRNKCMACCCKGLAWDARWASMGSLFPPSGRHFYYWPYDVSIRMSVKVGSQLLIVWNVDSRQMSTASIPSRWTLLGRVMCRQKALLFSRGTTQTSSWTLFRSVFITGEHTLPRGGILIESPMVDGTRRESDHGKASRIMMGYTVRTLLIPTPNPFRVVGWILLE